MGFVSAGCSLTIVPAAPIGISTQAAPPTIAPNTGLNSEWTVLRPGLEQRFYTPPSQGVMQQVVALRIDPALYRFRVHYQPGAPLALGAWLAALPEAVVLVNGNFFDPQGYILGLLVADGVFHGQSYVGRGGMFEVLNDSPGVRSLVAQPYAGEALEQALQAFPMLVVDGEASYTNISDRDISRRTVVAQDSQGRVILLATLLFGMRLTDLSAFLATADLDIVNALNLDGGGSTMMYIGPGDTPFSLPSFDAVPAVLAVYPR